MTRMPRKLLIIAIFSTSCIFSSCVQVKPWQRANLSKKAMIDDQQAGERRFEEHQRSAREGASGGSGKAAGGCGCN